MIQQCVGVPLYTLSFQHYVESIWAAVLPCVSRCINRP